MPGKPCAFLALLLALAAPAIAGDRAPETRVRLDRQDHNVVRSGPGEHFTLVGVVEKGETFPVIAKSGAWYNIRLDDTLTGWVHASLCTVLEDMGDLEFHPNPKLYSRVGTFVLTATVSGYSFDRKSNSFALGGRIGYYALSFVELEASLGWTRVVRPAEIVESLFDLRLEEERFDMLFYAVNATVEVLPGRRLVPFVTAGAGATVMQGKSEASVNLGAGTRMYLSKRTALRWELRNYRFTSGTEQSRRGNNNFEMIFGTSFLF